MDIKQFIKQVNAIDWSIYDEATGFFASRIPQALTSLAVAEKEDKSNESRIKEGENIDLILNEGIYNDILDLITNVHCGIYYPVTERVLPFILEIALSANHVVARNCAINCLVDIYSFFPEDGSDQLEEVVKTAIEENRESFAALSMKDEWNSKLLKTLINIIDEALLLKKNNVTFLFRYVSRKEYGLIKHTDWTEFPLLPHKQSVDFAAAEQEYTSQSLNKQVIPEEILRGTAPRGASYLIRVAVKSEYLEKYNTEIVHREKNHEFRVSSNMVNELNSNIVGHIEVIGISKR